MPHLENFFLPTQFLRDVDLDEVTATFDAMGECGVDRAPFPEFYITCPEVAILQVTKDGRVEQPVVDHGHLMEFHYSGLTGQLSQPAAADGLPGFIAGSRIKVLSWKGNKQSLDWFQVLPRAIPDKELANGLAQKLAYAGASLLQILVVSLATRGIVKEREANKLAKLGIGKKTRAGRHAYTTTISAPQGGELEDDGHPARPGVAKRPHLRRGHVRRQHHGPGNQWVKSIFVEPVFVNSDREFVSLRDHYNISFTPKLNGAEPHV